MAKKQTSVVAFCFKKQRLRGFPVAPRGILPILDLLLEIGHISILGERKREVKIS